MNTRLAQKIRKARLAAGFTQAQLAEKIGYSTPRISQWEQGSKVPDEVMKSLEENLGPLVDVDVSDFGLWVQATRTAKRMSVHELSKKSGVTMAAIYNIERGTSQNPQAVTRDALSKALGGAPKEILTEIQEASKSVEGIGPLNDFFPHLPKNWPTCGGVYVLYDVSQRAIYVGKSEQIAKRLAAHKKSAFWYREPMVQYGSYIEVKNKILRHQLEQAMIRFMKKNAVLNDQSTQSFDDSAAEEHADD